MEADFQRKNVFYRSLLKKVWTSLIYNIAIICYNFPLKFGIIAGGGDTAKR